MQLQPGIYPHPIQIVGEPSLNVAEVDSTGHVLVTGTVTVPGTVDVNIHDSAGNALTSLVGSLNVNVTNFPASQQVTQGTTPWIVDGSGTIQPVSGTVTALQGTSPWVVSGTISTSPDVNIHDSSGNILSSLTGSLNVNPTTLPPGASTSALQTTGNASLASIDNQLASHITVNQGTQALPGNAWYTAITDGASTVGITGFSLNVDVTNAVGNAAVNIRDGGNSITVDGTVTALQGTSPWVVSGSIATSPDVNIHSSSGGTLAATGTSLNVNVTNTVPVSGAVTVSGTVAATQSGTWNINNISGTVSLPTGAATEATLSTLNGKVPSGLTVTSTRLLVDGSGVTQPISASSLPLPTGASTAANQTTANTSLSSIDSKTPTFGQKTMANSSPVVIASDQSTLPVVQANSTKNTYSASVAGIAPALLATDIFTMTGSIAKTIKVWYVQITANRTTSAAVDILLIKRSTTDSGGTGFPITAVPHDSNDAGATTTAAFYIANPTLGTSVGVVRSYKMFINSPATGISDAITWEFGVNGVQPVTLRGAQQLVVNLNGVTVVGGSFDISITWTEE